MGKKSTASKNAWCAKAYDQLRIVVRKGQKERIQAYAQEKGESLNGYINRLISEDMGEHLTNPNKE